MDRIRVGLIILSKSGHIESLNHAAEQIFGFRSEEIVGRHLSVLFVRSSEETDAQFMERFCDFCLGSLCDTKMVRKDGTIIPIEITLSSLNNPEGQRYLLNVLRTQS